MADARHPQVSKKFGSIGNRFNLRTIFKTKHTLRGALMKTGPVRDAQQTKQCVSSIPCYCGRRYIGETRKPVEVRIKEHKYNLAEGLFEKSKLAQHAYEEAHKICWNEAKVLQIEPKTTYRKSTCLCWTIRSVNPVWTSHPSGPRYHSRSQETTTPSVV
jgi:hypothetical protein